MSTPSSVVIDGIRCFAPRLAESCQDYPAEIYSALVRIEEEHFWFRSRNAVIRQLVTKYLSGGGVRHFLEIGCGTGYVLKMLAAIPRLKCIGAEIRLQGAHIAKNRVPAAEIIQLDACQIPFEATFDAVGAFDVIEHVETDEQVIQNVHRALKDGGYVFLTVPQHPFLWSYQDDFAGHKRRYTRSELLIKLARNGFRIEYAGSFCCTVFPFMLLSRLTKSTRASTKDKVAEVLAEFNIFRPLNSLLRLLMRLDETVIRYGGSLPFGGSLVAVGRKCKARENGRCDFRKRPGTP
jgi:SAM-dependent methyltransferase